MPIYEWEHIFFQQKHSVEFFALVHWEGLLWLQIIVELC